MGKFLVVITFLGAMSSFAGDLYLNCGEGKTEDMEEFLASSIVDERKSHVIFSKNNMNYSVVFNNDEYEITKSDQNVGGYTKNTYFGFGWSRQTPLFDGFSCHISN